MSTDVLSSLIPFVVVALTIFVLLLARAVDRLCADTASLQQELDSLCAAYSQAHPGPSRDKQMNAAMCRWYDQACRNERTGHADIA